MSIVIVTDMPKAAASALALLKEAVTVTTAIMTAADTAGTPRATAVGMALQSTQSESADGRGRPGPL